MLLRLFCNLPKYLYIAGLVLMLLLVMFSPMFIHAQKENTFYVKGFAGPSAQTVGRMTDAAQNSCDPNTAIPCVLIFDPTLASYPEGLMPTKCANCTWLDYRSVVGGGSFKNGVTTQARNTMTARVPANIDVESGSSASPTTTKYQTSPNLYVSDYGATDASNCITGYAAPCLSPLALFEGTNQSTTTTADLTGLAVNLWGAKGSTSPTTWGNQWIGGVFGVWDSTTPNVVSMYGLNPNMGAQSVPGQCFKGTVDVSTTCARTVLGTEIDVTNATAVDGVHEQKIGNQLLGLTVGCYSTNATPSDCTAGIKIGTGTTGHGFKIGQVIGGAVNVGLMIPQAQISNKPDIGIHVASQGAYGIVVGTGSTTYSHGLSQTLANPAIGILLDALRLEGNTTNVQSNILQMRAANGAGTYVNSRVYESADGVTHFASDLALQDTFVDMMTIVPNATTVNSGVQIAGTVTTGNMLTVNRSVGNGTGLKHGRVTTGSIAAGATAQVTLTWGGTAFVSNPYTTTCSVQEATTTTASLRVDHIASQTNSTVVVVVNNTGAGALTGTLHCIAMHD